jgi:N-glycosylase/DNA lyase
VVDALVDLGFESFILLDKAEPEYKVFMSLLSSGTKPEMVALLGVCTGLIDYQLAEGGATALWREAQDTARSVGILTIDDVKQCMEQLLQKPVCSRKREQKVRRIARFFSSDVPAKIAEHFSECIIEPLGLWYLIAEAVGSSPEKKTIAFAVKAFDLAVFCSSERYLKFENEPPIAVDFHVRGISEILGLVPPGASDDEIRRIWFRVSDAVSKKTSQRISPLRIDSLIWQTGTLTYDPATKKHSPFRIKQLGNHLDRIGIGESSANAFLKLLLSRPF